MSTPPQTQFNPPPPLRPALVSMRTASSNRMPRLGLAIPPPAAQKTVVNSQAIPALEIPTRQALPKLSVVSPKDTSLPTKRLPPLHIGSISNRSLQDFSDDSSKTTGRPDSRTCSNATITTMTTGGTGTTTASSYSINQTHTAKTSNTDPMSGYSLTSTGAATTGGGVGSLEREDSLGNQTLPDLDKLAIDIGRPVDAEDLNDVGWKAAVKNKRIIELGSLGEGAGGAVTRCRLKDGNTVFALKVCLLIY